MERGGANQPARGSAEYVMSRSRLVEFCLADDANPAKWVKSKDSFESTNAMEFGSLLDCLLTAPERFGKKYVVRPLEYPVVDKKGVETGDMKPWSGNSTWCKEWLESVPKGVTAISHATLGRAQDAVRQIESHPWAVELIQCSKKQVLIVADWHDDATGITVPFAALLDLIPDASNPAWGKTLADIKTARNGNPEGWARVVNDSGYDVQSAIYMDLYRAAVPNEDRADFVHLVIENTEPFDIVCPPPCLSSEFLEWGRAKYRRALAIYCQCLKTGVWPSYPARGIQFGKTQIIGPDELFKYRQCTGSAEFIEPQQEQSTNENNEIIP